MEEKEYKGIKQRDLYKRFSKIDNKIFENAGISKEDIEWIKKRITKNPKGFLFDFKELDKENKLKDNYFVFKENENLSINNKGKRNNLLIEGDNYEGLRALKSTGIKVDVIYIDPPYNTGKEFIYSDDYQTNPKPVGNDDVHKHSKWLSFMKKRLILASELLSEDGIIFVSIDDNEQAYLKVLMDEIFGEDNFVANFPRKTRGGGGYSGKNIGMNFDYLITYKLKLSPSNRKDNHLFEFEKKSNSINKYRKLQTLGAEEKRSDRPTMFFKIKINDQIYLPKLKDGIDGRWGFGKKKVEEMIENNRIISDNGVLKYLEMTSQYSIHETFNKSFMSEFTNGKGTKCYKELGLGQREPADLMRPKPVQLIKWILSTLNNKNAIVLDFFAGSGTTGQAVMELNKEDGGNRRFILVTNNERSGYDTIKNPEYGIARTITRERIYRVINGKGSKGEEIKWELPNELQKDGNKYLSNESLNYLKVKTIHKVDGKFEEIEDLKELYDKEFQTKDFSIVELENA